MKIIDLQDFKGKRVKISYNSKDDEVCRDEGILNNISPGFITLEVFDKAKFISTSKIIRIEEC